MGEETAAARPVPCGETGFGGVSSFTEGRLFMVQSVLKNLLEGEDIDTALQALEKHHPADIAESMREFSTEEQEKIILLLSDELAAHILQEMDLSEETAIFERLDPVKAAEILKLMFTDEAVDVLSELEEEQSEIILALLDEPGRELMNLMEYEEDTSGGLMATEYVTVNENDTVRDVLNHLRKVSPSAESAYYIYVVKSDGTLQGVVSLRELVIAHERTRISRIMKTDIIKVPEDMDQEDVANLFDKYGYIVLPVVDAEGKLLGIITVDDALDVARREATEDIHKAGSVNPLRDEYSNTPVLTLYGKRIGWLLGLIFVNLVSSGIMAAFEETLSGAIVLAFFIPLLIDTGGNTGSQSATLVVRALVTGDLKLSHWLGALVKELGVGALLGLTLGLAGWLLGLFRGGFAIGLVVGTTMMAIVIISNIIGVILPFALTRLKLDPAVASSPLITSIADATGLIVYFSIADFFLKI